MSTRLALGLLALAAVSFTHLPLVGSAAEPVKPPRPPTLQSTWRPPVADSSYQPPPPAPKPLSQTQLGAQLKKYATQARSPIVPTAPQTLEWRVTPMAPRLPNGTRIAIAHDIAFYASSDGYPGGMYRMFADGTYHSSWIEIGVTTEKDRLYVADCRIQDYGIVNPTQTIQVFAPGLDQLLIVDDGHAVFAFRGDAGTSTVWLVFDDPDRNLDRSMAFYGCDFGKAG